MIEITVTLNKLSNLEVLPESSWERQALRWKIQTLRPVVDRTAEEARRAKTRLDLSEQRLTNLLSSVPEQTRALVDEILGVQTDVFQRKKTADYLKRLAKHTDDLEQLSIDSIDTLKQLYEIKKNEKSSGLGIEEISLGELYEFRHSARYTPRTPTLSAGKTFYKL
jgi:hypothetical protein